MAILLLCVNYKNDDETIEFVQKVRCLDGSDDVFVAVVDNSASKANAIPIGDRLANTDQTSVLEAPDNPGYLPGAARGLAYFLERAEIPEWVIVSNTDIDFPDPLLFQKLTSIKDEGDIGIIAPHIHSSLTRSPQNPFMPERPSKFRTWIRSLTASSTMLLRVARQIARKKREYAGGQADKGSRSAIFAPHGAFMIFHQRFFTNGGDLENGNRLFGEEIYVGEVARLLGLKVIYEPKLAVIHNEHSAVQQLDWEDLRKHLVAAHKNTRHILSRSFALNFRQRVESQSGEGKM